MTWAQVATLIVSIAGVVIAGTGVVVFSVNGIHSQVATMQAEGAADRRAGQAAMDAFRAEAKADREAFQAKADADRDALRAEAKADRAAFREEVRRLGERQARVEGALSTALAPAP